MGLSGVLLQLHGVRTVPNSPAYVPPRTATNTSTTVGRCPGGRAKPKLACDAATRCERSDFVDAHHLERHRAVKHIAARDTACKHPDCAARGVHRQDTAELILHIERSHHITCSHAAHPWHVRPRFESHQDFLRHERRAHGPIAVPR